MKKITITFGTGNDSIIHNIEVSNPNELASYLSDLYKKGWNLSEITSIISF